jgi:hypothetical protein
MDRLLRLLLPVLNGDRRCYTLLEFALRSPHFPPKPTSIILAGPATPLNAFTFNNKHSSLLTFERVALYLPSGLSDRPRPHRDALSPLARGMLCLRV